MKEEMIKKDYQTETEITLIITEIIKVIRMTGKIDSITRKEINIEIIILTNLN